jgi:hypothetical protein
MNSPKTATANWKTQYYLNVTSVNATTGGSGWYDSGTNATATLNSLTVAGSTGTQYVFTNWSGNATGTTSPSNNITMTAPKTAIANWQTQYNLTFAQSGVGSDFSGNVLIVNGTSYDINGFSTWANASNIYTFNYAPQVVAAANSKQCLLTTVSGNSSALSVIVSQPTTIAGTYKTQYYLTTTGFYNSPSPANGWYDNGTSISAFVASPVAVSSGIQSVCTGWSGTGSTPAAGNSSATSFAINAPSTIAWTWKTQYLVSFAVTPSGSASTSPSTGSIWEDAGVYSISVTPNYGYALTSWTTDTGNITLGSATQLSTSATINGPGTITANIVTYTAPTPTPTPSHTSTPTHTPTPSNSPSPPPSPTSTPTSTPIVSPTPTPPKSTQNLATNPYLYGAVVAIVLIAILAAIITIRKRKKTSTSE